MKLRHVDNRLHMLKVVFGEFIYWPLPNEYVIGNIYRRLSSSDTFAQERRFYVMREVSAWWKRCA